MTKFYAFMRFLVGGVIKLFFPTKFFGTKKLEPKKTLLAINHFSNLDPIIAGCNLSPQLYFWGKKEIFNTKAKSKFFSALGVLPVSRGSADIASVKSALTLLKQDKVFALYPEGTRNKNIENEEMSQIKSGLTLLAIKGQAPIRIVLMHRKPKFLTRNYVLVCEPFSLDQFYGQKVSSEVLSEATKIIECEFQKAHDELNMKLIERGVLKIENHTT